MEPGTLLPGGDSAPTVFYTEPDVIFPREPDRGTGITSHPYTGNPAGKYHAPDPAALFATGTKSPAARASAP